MNLKIDLGSSNERRAFEFDLSHNISFLRGFVDVMESLKVSYRGGGGLHITKVVFSPIGPGFKSSTAKIFSALLRYVLYCLVRGQLINRTHLMLKMQGISQM